MTDTIKQGQAIRSWCNSLPGPVSAPTAEEVVRKSWAMCGVCCDVETFRVAIAAYGFVPDQVGAVWWLRFPGESMRVPDNTAKLRNIVGRGQR